MIRDARDVPTGQALEAEVCIIGAGAAGISLAREFRDEPFRTVLLESGGYEREPETQALYRGEIVGHAYYPLEQSRIRFLGGSTNHWGGMCLPFDPIDFEERTWVPHSGWPIGLADLLPFYPRAQKLCELGPFDYGLPYWSERRGKQPPPIAGGPIIPGIAQFSPPTLFGKRYRKSLEESRSVTTYLHANVLDLETDRSGRTVQRVNVAVLGGGRFTVSARVFVLATGAIENARLLLLSRRGHPAGLGNQHDQVGRYFMERVNYRSGVFFPSDGRSWKLFLERDRLPEVGINGILAIDPAWQRQNLVLNSSIALHASAPASRRQAEDDGGFWDFLAALWERPPEPVTLFQIWHDVEPVPNPRSRVLLGEERDALGQPSVQLDWRLTPDLEGETIRRVVRVFATEVGRLGLGRVRVEMPEGDDWSEKVVGSYHHMGTTRMHADPRQGVVDADCRVHRTRNLYVAGSSVFPTAGQANPTLTLLALALRTGDRIRGMFT